MYEILKNRKESMSQPAMLLRGLERSCGQLSSLYSVMLILRIIPVIYNFQENTLVIVTLQELSHRHFTRKDISTLIEGRISVYSKLMESEMC